MIPGEVGMEESTGLFKAMIALCIRYGCDEGWNTNKQKGKYYAGEIIVNILYKRDVD